MALAVTAVFPAVVARDGGEELTLTGTFVSTDTYTVTVDGRVAFGGVAGGGSSAVFVDATTLKCVMPKMDPGVLGPVVLLVTGDPSTETDSLMIDVSENVFGSAQYEMRRMMEPWKETGARRLDLEPPE